MNSVLSLFLLIGIVAVFQSKCNVSASNSKNQIPIGHYDGTWKLMYPAPSDSTENNIVLPSWFCTSRGQSSQSLCEKINEFINSTSKHRLHHHGRVFPSSEGNLQLKSIFNVTSSSISTDLNLIQGSFLEPGRMREITSTSQKYSGTGKCLRGGSGSSATVCTNFAQGFLGFWEEENNGYFSSEEEVNKANQDAEIVKDDFIRFEQVFTTTMKSQENIRLQKNKNKIVDDENDDQKSFRQLLNPDLWSMKEEEIFSQCVWITSWKSESSNRDETTTTTKSHKNRDNYYIQLSNLFRLQTLFFEQEEEDSVDFIFRPSKAQAIEGIVIGLCNSSSESTSSSRSFFLTVSRLEADTTRYDQRMIAATWFAGLTVVSAILNAYSIFALGTIARRSLHVQRSLSFASLLWIVSIDLLYLGVFQLLARQLTPRAARVVYLGMFIRVLTFYIGGVPLILSVRKTQQDYLVAADRGGRWLVAELSVWRYFGMILAFTITLFLLSERMLSWPVILLFSSFFYPQIVQNVVEDEATQPIPQFTWGVFISVCLPVCAITGAGTFSNLMNSDSFFFFLNQHPFAFKARTASAVAFAVSLFVQAVILHLQVRFGPRCFIPSYFLPPKYPYEVDAKSVKFVTPETGKSNIDDANKRDVLIDKTTTCSICQGLLRVDPNSSEEEEEHEENIDDESAMKAESSLDQILEESTTTTSTNHANDDDTAKINASNSTLPILWKTPCDHFFHAICLKPWLEVRLVCPVCREMVPKP